MRDEFAVAWRALDDDPEVRVIVHTGRGPRVPDRRRRDRDRDATASGMQRYRESVENFDLHFTSWHNDVWKPVITAVNGICAGGGFHWVADADIVIAASDAQFFDPHVSIGQVVVDRGDRADEEDAGRGRDADGVRRPLRAACRRRARTSSA